MQRPNILRMFLFVFFFSIGAGALSCSILCDELLEYFRNRGLLKSAEESLGHLKALNSDYDVLLGQLEEDPNLVKRIGPATLGTEPAEVNVLYPRATAEKLAAAKKTLAEDSKRDQQTDKAVIPGWVLRCGRPAARIILFISGAVLILISFVCFGSVKGKS